MKRRRVMIWIAIAVGCVVLGCVGMAWLIYSPPNGTSINSVPSAKGLVALTFDDGPNPPYTDEILAILAEENVTATFFMTGKFVEAHPDCARRVFAAGHEIANHAWDDQVLAFKSRAAIKESIARTDRALEDALGESYERSPYFRAPQGQQFVELAGVLRRQNRIHVGAYVFGNDWQPEYQQDPQRVADKILNSVDDGSIIILHDGNDHQDGANRAGSVEATRLVLQELKDRGLMPVTVGELMRSGGSN